MEEAGSLHIESILVERQVAAAPCAMAAPLVAAGASLFFGGP